MRIDKRINPYDYNNIWRQTYGDQQTFGPVHKHMRRLLMRELRSLDYSTVIDVGCGMGHNIPILGTNHTIGQYDGMDISQVVVQHGKKHLSGGFHLIDIQKSYLSKKADLVFSSLVLEHLVDDVAAIGHLKKMSKKWLVVTTIAGDMEKYITHERQMGHVRNYRKGELEYKLQKAGFTVVKSIYWGFPFYSPIARRLSNTVRIKNSFSVVEKITTFLLSLLYYCNSSTKGDLLILVARVS